MGASRRDGGGHEGGLTAAREGADQQQGPHHSTATADLKDAAMPVSPNGPKFTDVAGKPACCRA